MKGDSVRLTREHTCTLAFSTSCGKQWVLRSIRRPPTTGEKDNGDLHRKRGGPHPVEGEQRLVSLRHWTRCRVPEERLHGGESSSSKSLVKRSTPATLMRVQYFIPYSCSSFPTLPGYPFFSFPSSFSLRSIPSTQRRGDSFRSLHILPLPYQVLLDSPVYPWSSIRTFLLKIYIHILMCMYRYTRAGLGFFLPPLVPDIHTFYFLF